MMYTCSKQILQLETQEMPAQGGKITKTIETVVKLYGNQQENIQNILENMHLDNSQLENVKAVLSILYAKMEKLRQERNQLRLLLYQQQQLFCQYRNQIETLKVQLSQSKYELEKMAVKPDQYTFENSISQTPPMKQAYRSMQLQQDKENRPLTQVKFISSFQTQTKQFGGQFGILMKKYNLTANEFKNVVMHYVEEERKALLQLETDSQKQLYLQSKKTKNYDEWFKKMRKECGKGKKGSGSLVSLPPNINSNDI